MAWARSRRIVRTPPATASSQRDQPEAPEQRPGVVAIAGALGLPQQQVAAGVGRELLQLLVEEAGAQERVRVAEHERDGGRRAREQQAQQHGHDPPVAERHHQRRPEQRQQDERRVVLEADGDAQPDAGQRVLPQPPGLEHAGDADQRQRRRRQRGRVVERQVAVVDRQERRGQHGGGDQADPAVEHPPSGHVEQRDRRRGEQRARHPGHGPDLARIVLPGAHHRAR